MNEDFIYEETGTLFLYLRDKEDVPKNLEEIEKDYVIDDYSVSYNNDVHKVKLIVNYSGYRGDKALLKKNTEELEDLKEDMFLINSLVRNYMEDEFEINDKTNRILDILLED